MTGFGRGEGRCDACEIVVEIKSVNSKSLDLSQLRLPSRYREREGWIRGELSRRVVRGKVDCSISFSRSAQEGGDAPRLNQEIYKQSVQSVFATIGELDNAEKPSLARVALKLSRLPFIWEVPEDAPSEEEFAALERAMDLALKDFLDYRAKEGAATRADLERNAGAIRSLLEQVDGLKEGRIEAVRARMEEALGKLVDPVKGVFDEQRFNQELIYHIERLDINEEIQRLGQHLDFFGQTMEEGEAQGRKLAFIGQEMGREINTIGSKANSSEIQHLVVEMKDHLEKIKEQVLNVL